MRIGVDGTCLANPRGYGRYARELLAALPREAPDDDFVVFLDRRSAQVLGTPPYPNVRPLVVRQSRSPTEAAASDGSRSPWDMLRLTAAVRREAPDVFLSPSVYTFFPLPPRLPAVVAIHDAIAERFPELTLPSRRARLFWAAKVWLAIRQARLILTVSDFSRRELERVHGIARDRIRVGEEAPADVYRPEPDPGRIERVAAAIGLPRGARWFTYVGGFNPHKNIDALVRAHARLVGEAEPDPPFLVLVGTIRGDVFHGCLPAIREEIERQGTGPLVRWTGYLADEDLRSLHTGALGLVLPSECEGFGLPAVEAAACGCPVVATTESPLPDLLEGGGFFVAPGDEEGLFAAMAALCDEEERRCRGARALRQTEALDWGTTARTVLEALREAAP